MRSLNGISALDYLAKYCILTEEQLRKYRKVFESVDLDRDGFVNHNELEFGIRTVNTNMVSGKEIMYVSVVLEIRREPKIDFRMFAVICALSERVVSYFYVRLFNFIYSEKPYLIGEVIQLCFRVFSGPEGFCLMRAILAHFKLFVSQTNQRE